MAANPEAGAVTDVTSAAAALEARYSEPEAEHETETAEAEAAEDVTDEVAEVEEETESEEPSEESAESDDLEATESEEAPEFHSVEELAQALELSPEEFMDKIKGRVKINGEETEVTLSELTKGYQMESDYRRKTMELAEQRKAFEQEQSNINQQLQAKVTEATNMVATLEQSLLGDYQNVDWNTLRSENPEQYLLAMHDFNQRQAQIESVKQQATTHAQTLQSEAQQKQTQQFQEVLAKESESLLSFIPEWKDQEVAQKGKTEIKNFLNGYGFSNDEISQIIDHRHVLLIRDAMKGKKISSKASEAVKQVKKVPKLIKPGAKPSKNAAKADRQAELRNKLRKSGGKVDDVAALLLDRS